MIVDEKIINEYQIGMRKDYGIFGVFVRKIGVREPIFLRIYSSLSSARRSYKRWCIKINDINCRELANVK